MIFGVKHDPTMPKGFCYVSHVPTGISMALVYNIHGGMPFSF